MAAIVQLLASPVHRYEGRPADGPAPAPPGELVEEVQIRAGLGIVGDRYFGRPAHREASVTVIAQESLPPGADLVQVRRNILVSGIAVDDLVGSVLILDSGDGPVRLRCPPRGPGHRRDRQLGGTREDPAACAPAGGERPGWRLSQAEGGRCRARNSTTGPGGDRDGRRQGRRGGGHHRGGGPPAGGGSGVSSRRPHGGGSRTARPDHRLESGHSGRSGWVAPRCG
jgi:hypothetical protein